MRLGTINKISGYVVTCVAGNIIKNIIYEIYKWGRRVYSMRNVENEKQYKI